LFLPDAVDVLGWATCCARFDYCDQLPVCWSVRMACGRREPPRRVNLQFRAGCKPVEHPTKMATVRHWQALRFGCKKVE